MAPSDSVSPPRRLSKEDRTSSSNSVPRGSPPSKGKGHRAHLAGHGRIHTRNASYGKNLNKLAKLADEGDKARSPPPTSGGGGGGGGHMKRNSSTTSLPRTGSKVSIRRNTSNVSLKRNSSHGQMLPQTKAQRPPTPLRKSSSRGKELDRLGHPRETKFILDDGDAEGLDVDADDDDDDNEWTEESASQSPSVTRQSSTSKRTAAAAGKAEPETSQPERPNPPASPPDSPPLTAVKRPETKDQSSFVDVSHPNHHASRPPDADALTSRLLARRTSSKPQITSVSATGTPGTHTPPTQQTAEPQPSQSSLPGDGISRFIGAQSASLSGSANPLLRDVGQRQPSFSGLSSERSSPPTGRGGGGGGGDGDAIRRTRSSGNIGGSGKKPTARLESPGSDSGRGGAGGLQSYRFEAGQQRRSNFTQVRMELWRNQTAIEPSHGPPAPIISRLPVSELGVEERRVRQWEEAETQMHHLKRFRNPAVDGARRALKRRTPSRDARSSAAGSMDKLSAAAASSASLSTAARRRDGPAHASRPRTADGQRTPGGTAARDDDGQGERGSRHTPRSVRFEVGLDGGDEAGVEDSTESLHPHPSAERGLETLLRSLWVGGEMEMGGEE